MTAVDWWIVHWYAAHPIGELIVKSLATLLAFAVSYALCIHPEVLHDESRD